MDEIGVSKERIVHTEEKESLLVQLLIANRELAFNIEEKENRAAELLIANKELAIQNAENKKLSAELAIANEQLAFKNIEKEKLAGELINEEPAFICSDEFRCEKLIFQNEEKEKRAEELFNLNGELAFQNYEKGKRAAELAIANKELTYQNREREARAAELVLANKELALQNFNKEKLALELIIANKELAFQSEEKGKRAAELVVANKELIYQNWEKEQRAVELAAINKELLTFTYISNHDLQEPLRKIQVYVSRILGAEYEALSPATKNHFQKIQIAAERMRGYMKDLLLYQYASNAEYKFEKVALALILSEVKNDLSKMIEEKNATIVFNDPCYVNTMFVSFRQLLYNIIHNSLKFSRPGIPPHIVITASSVESSVLDIETVNVWKRYCHIVIQDNGIGFEPEFSDRIFEIFQRLHSKEEYPGTGIGLAIAKKIVAHHKGVITARSKPGKGTTVDIYIPEL